MKLIRTGSNDVERLERVRNKIIEVDKNLSNEIEQLIDHKGELTILLKSNSKTNMHYVLGLFFTIWHDEFEYHVVVERNNYAITKRYE